MNNRLILFATLVAAVAVSCCRTGETPVSTDYTFNGYTNHWQNVYQQQYRWSNLYRYNVPDMERTIAQTRKDLAEKIGVPGLQIQEGFFAGLAAEAAKGKGNVLVCEVNEDAKSVCAYKKGNTYKACGPASALDTFKTVVDGALQVAEEYELKRGWFGCATTIQTVGCSPGTPIDVMGRGMNEGNSWFVFSGGYENHSKGKIANWVDEVGVNVVTDLGASPLFGCDDWDDFQDQLMGEKDAWKNYKARKHGYIFKPAGPEKGRHDNTDDDDYDGFFVNLGNEKQLNESTKPFVNMTGLLLGGTTNNMVLFVPKGVTFDKAAMWSAIMDRRSVAVGENATVIGSDLWRKTVQFMMLDRVYLEQYFGDRVDIQARIEGTTLKVRFTNFYDHKVKGDFSVTLPEQVALGGKVPSRLSIPAGATREICVELDPAAAAMGRMNAVVVNFNWGESCKSTMANLNMPPAVGTHQLLYGDAAGTKFPVSLYNFTNDPELDLKICVSPADDPSRVVWSKDEKVSVAKASAKILSYEMALDPGAYTVVAEAMGVKAETQLGIGSEKGEVAVKAVDLDGDGVDEYVMENSKVRVTLLTTGARVIEYYVKSRNDNVFFKLWPEKPYDVRRPYREWAFWPFGGFEDFLGQASMETHKVYDAEIIKSEGNYAEVRMFADYNGNTIEKIFSLYGDTPLLGIRFALDFINPELNVLGPQPIVQIGKTHGKEDKFIIPEIDGQHTYTMDPEKMWGKILDLKEGWNAAYDTREDVAFVGAYPVERPYYLHMWMNLATNPDSNYPYTELQPWVPLYQNSTSYFSYYMWAEGADWKNGLKELRNRNLITERK